VKADLQQACIDKFKSRDALIGIVGLGYVGLPLMLRYNSNILLKRVAVGLKQPLISCVQVSAMH
jgi:UDP-N-acetyl-D-mannosaminuronate dehydrogenase